MQHELQQMMIESDAIQLQAGRNLLSLMVANQVQSSTVLQQAHQIIAYVQAAQAIHAARVTCEHTANAADALAVHMLLVFAHQTQPN
jgi:hypothetical protein